MTTRPTSPKFTFPVERLSKIGTIEESHQESSFDATTPTSTNPFEKSFGSFSQKHLKNDSVNSVETLSSFKLHRFNSSSSCSSISSSSFSPGNNYNSNSNSFKKFARFSLQDSVQSLSSAELSTMIEDEEVLIVDVRTFIEFEKNHIKNSINFNIPSTLLKRANFTLSKCLNNLSFWDNVKLKKFLEKDQNNLQNKKLIIYDDFEVFNDEVSLGIFGSLNKFLNDEDFDGDFFILSNGFQSFQRDYPDLIIGDEESEDLMSLPPPQPIFGSHHFSFSSSSNSSLTSNNSDNSSSGKFPHNRSLSLASLSTNGLSVSGYSSSSNPSSSSPISPNLSRFQLPKLPKYPIFKIRHNEEMIEDSDRIKADQKYSRGYTENDELLSDFKHLSNIIVNHDYENLPKWFIRDLDVAKLSNKLVDNFKILEIHEKKRINEMICNNNIGFGIELGMKNRYKDIFPYEHSRVKLKHDDYINANFINCGKFSNMKYIATQAPLITTLPEFEKLIDFYQVKLIISLTNQFENGIEKCYPFWEENLKYCKVLSVYKVNENLIIRRLHAKLQNKQVLQMQITNWSDYDVMLKEQQDDVLRLIFLKNLVLNNLNLMSGKEEQVLVHCSAGCGRTGTFCTLDSIINNQSNIEAYYNQNHQNDSLFDPVFEIVEIFRNQRISMVQNLRQYLFIYDCLINFFKNFQKEDDIFNELTKLEILKDFIKMEADRKQEIKDDLKKLDGLSI